MVGKSEGGIGMKAVRIFLFTLIWWLPTLTFGITGIVAFGNEVESDAIKIICTLLFWTQCSILGLVLADKFNEWFKSKLKEE